MKNSGRAPLAAPRTRIRTRAQIRARRDGKKTRTEAEYQGLRKKIVALARCAMLTLDSRGRIGVGSGMVIDLKTREVSRWETQFFDALDQVGIVYDRTRYATSLRHKNLRRRSRPATQVDL